VNHSVVLQIIVPCKTYMHIQLNERTCSAVGIERPSMEKIEDTQRQHHGYESRLCKRVHYIFPLFPKKKQQLPRKLLKKTFQDLCIVELRGCFKIKTNNKATCTQQYEQQIVLLSWTNHTIAYLRGLLFFFGRHG
jgi:hypothetical protein